MRKFLAVAALALVVPLLAGCPKNSNCDNDTEAASFSLSVEAKPTCKPDPPKGPQWVHPSPTVTP